MHVYMHRVSYGPGCFNSKVSQPLTSLVFLNGPQDADLGKARRHEERVARSGEAACPSRSRQFSACEAVSAAANAQSTRPNLTDCHFEHMLTLTKFFT